MMTRWGVGPKFTLISAIYFAAILTAHFIFLNDLTFTIISHHVNLILGIVLIILGLTIFLLGGHVIDKYFTTERLCTTGVYAFMRHPIYGAWIVYIVPGIIIIMGSIIGITIPIFMYCVYKILIVKEERYLEAKYGREYLEYASKVGALFPKIWRVYHE
jgi:protein-S-isoprenylcysteine O-methyltransferase Ste14